MWEKDLKDAQVEERKLAELLVRDHGFKSYALNNSSAYDIWLKRDNKNITVELKHDKYTNDRVAVEVFCLRRLKPTGIMATKADYVCFLKNGAYYFVKTSKLKSILRPDMFVLGGDNRASVMALVELKHLEPISIKIKYDK